MNQGELSDHCSFIGINDADFNSQCLSYSKRFFYENLSPKNHSQVSFEIKVYQDSVLVSFASALPNITTAIHAG